MIRHRIHVFIGKKDRPYFEAWLRRTSKQLAISGRLTQVASVLSKEQGGTVDDWRIQLRTLLEGTEVPSLELLTRIDVLLSGTKPSKIEKQTQGVLFF